jgi:hypothetical protein
VIREIVQAESGPRSTNISAALNFVLHVQKQRCICFILSDFQDIGFESSLRVLARKHDVIGIHLLDASEAQLPDVGLLQLINPETGKTHWVDTASEATRGNYVHAQQSAMHQVEHLFKRNQADFLQIHTQKPYLAPLIGFFKQHGKK